MTIRNRLKRLEANLDTSAESVDRLMSRMQVRAEVNMRPALEAAVARANEAARACGLPETSPQPLSAAAQRLQEIDTPERAAEDQKRFERLLALSVVDGSQWRARNGGLTPEPGPVIAEARRKRDEQQQIDELSDNTEADYE